MSGINVPNSSCPVPVAQYNGNISAMKWKTKTLEAEPYETYQNMYVYRYDNLNRMTAGYYVASSPDLTNQDVFDQHINWFNEEVTYAASGNILELKRNGANFDTETYELMDDLKYSYSAYQALGVADLANPQVISYRGFMDGTNSGNDYTYDPSGNLTHDDNKDLDFYYNSLNLPYQEENPTTGEYITNTYDAGGRKIQQKLLSSAAIANTYPPVITDYIDGIEYKDLKLKQVLTEEARIRVTDASYEVQGYLYDYFLKDHLGSVRAVLSHDVLVHEYYATMEAQNAEAEEALFYNIPTTREDVPQK